MELTKNNIMKSTLIQNFLLAYNDEIHQTSYSVIFGIFSTTIFFFQKVALHSPCCLFVLIFGVHRQMDYKIQVLLCEEDIFATFHKVNSPGTSIQPREECVRGVRLCCTCRRGVLQCKTLVHIIPQLKLLNSDNRCPLCSTIHVRRKNLPHALASWK